MLTFYRYIKDVIQLYRISKNTSILKNEKTALDVIFKVSRKYKTKSPLRRELTAKIAITLRKKYPYIPDDYSQLKKEYDDYYGFIYGHINSISELERLLLKNDVYVTKFRNSCVVKGDRYCSYYRSISWEDSKLPEVYKISKVKNALKYLNLQSLSPSLSHCIDIDKLHMYRYSTKEEIDYYQNTATKIKVILDQIDFLNGEILGKTQKIRALSNLKFEDYVKTL